MCWKTQPYIFATKSQIYGFCFSAINITLFRSLIADCTNLLDVSYPNNDFRGHPVYQKIPMWVKFRLFSKTNITWGVVSCVTVQYELLAFILKYFNEIWTTEILSPLIFESSLTAVWSKRHIWLDISAVSNIDRTGCVIQTKLASCRTCP